MRIARRQTEALLQASPTRWLRFVCSALEDAYPMSPLFARDLSDDERLLKAADLCDRARANDLRTDAEILGFVFLMHEIAPHFDQHPYIRGLLDREGEPIGARWERLFQRRDEAIDRAFQEVEEGGRAAIDWHIERCGSIEEAFPATHKDPRFERCFQAVKARRGKG
jgi:hypothetical protein